jgi:hypothetical protein
MAMGKTANQNISEVKATCNSLEISPSCHTSTSPVQAGHPHTVRQPKHANMSKTHAGGRGTTKETGPRLKAMHHKRGH